MPGHIPWLLWRLYTTPHLRETKREIDDHWTLDDVLDAHAVIDAIMTAEQQR